MDVMYSVTFRFIYSNRLLQDGLHFTVINVYVPSITSVYSPFCLQGGPHWKVASASVVLAHAEDHAVSVAAMKASPYGSAFAVELAYRERSLNAVTDGVEMLLRVQSRWSYLGNHMNRVVFIATRAHNRYLCCSLTLVHK